MKNQETNSNSKPHIQDFIKMCFEKESRISIIADGFNVSMVTIYEWMKEDYEFKTAFDSIREFHLDMLADSLINKVKKINEPK